MGLPQVKRIDRSRWHHEWLNAGLVALAFRQHGIGSFCCQRDDR